MRLIYVSLAWCGGILAAASLPGYSAAFWAVCVLACAVPAILLWKANRWAGIALAAFALGGLRLSLLPSTSPIAAYNDSGGLTIEGEVISPPQLRDTYIQFRLAAQSITRGGETTSIDGVVLVQAPTVSSIHYGDRVQVTGMLISPYIFDRFDYSDYLARSGIYSLMTNTSTEVISTGGGSPLLAGILSLRGQLTSTINLALPEPAAGLLNGILLGDDSQITPQMRDAFAITGAAHILAVSGFNMIVIAGAVQGIMRYFRIGRAVTAIAALSMVAFYATLTGASPAILRAALMSGLLIAGGALRRKTFVPTSLAFAALIISFFEPLALWDVGFQLSFFAALALASFNSPISAWLNRVTERLFPRSITQLSGVITEPLATTLAVQAAVIPLIGLYFGQLSLVAPLVSMLIVPVQPILMILGGIAALVGIVAPQVAQLLFWLDAVLLGWTISIVRWFARLPFASITIEISARLIGLYFVLWITCGLVWLAYPEKVKPMLRSITSRPFVTAVLLASFCLLVLMGAKVASLPDGQMHVWFLDMNGSNAVLVQTPGGAHILIDGGSSPNRLLTAIGDRLPFDDRTLEVVVVTQPDAANYAALIDVLQRHDASLIAASGQPNLSEEWAELNRQADDQIFPLLAGYRLEFSDSTLIEVLHPSTTPDLQDGIDDSSLLLRLSYGDVSFLLSGDISPIAQRQLGAALDPASNVLQLPQHGREHSLDTLFLDRVQPQAAVVQTRSNSRQDDAAPEILALLDGIPVLDSAEGSIHFTTDGTRLWVVQEP